MKTLSEIRAELEGAQGAELERLCGEYEQDARKGVQKLLNQARHAALDCRLSGRSWNGWKPCAAMKKNMRNMS